MAYERAGTPPWAWLKSIGAHKEPLDRDWRSVDNHLLLAVWFSKHPRSLRAGDVLVYYAAGWQRCVALMQLVTDRVYDDLGSHPRHGKRWRWRMDVRPLVTVPMGDAPTLADVGIDPLRVRRQSHILLNQAEYAAARDQLLTAATHGSALSGQASSVVDP